ncbi:hypothetical protein, variant [Phytophthora nicotianae P1976]|uniref:Uncharacterized protein n=1 Tax=Phytophthora nicotianae P1976 TaxID=1317066 RepID=A0A080Z9L6_PHYNI|nr:hypothetical protein F444_18938 [Phytophthora nicotianae P1976]ETO63327.1 hypothetical protein, variant [Phytophthora nicotianae P1976]
MVARVETAELKASDAYSPETREQEPKADMEGVDSLLLHLIRIIALYLFVFLSQTAKLVVTDAELAIFVATPDLLDEETNELQRRLHVALLAWVKSEVKNDLFDGLLQEQRVFVVIKRLFRQQRTKAAAQYRVLAALLTSYLTRLQTPLVHCEPSSMLSSTLEYLLTKENDAASKEPIALSMLYPLVNAVDLVNIEQRECLDALMNLFRWLSVHDQSQEVFTTFLSKYHAKIITMTDDDTMPRFDSDPSNLTIKDELGMCFVQTLLRYSDHIFRRDSQFDDLVPTLSFSDTDDDDSSSEDGSVLTRLQSAQDSNLSAELLEKHTNSSAMNQIAISPDEEENALPAKVSSCSLFKRTKRDEKTMKVLMKSATKPSSQAAFVDDGFSIGMEWEDEEPLPTGVCFGIAAAGTLAAVLCVFLN